MFKENVRNEKISENILVKVAGYSRFDYCCTS